MGWNVFKDIIVSWVKPEATFTIFAIKKFGGNVLFWWFFWLLLSPAVSKFIKLSETYVFWTSEVFCLSSGTASETEIISKDSLGSPSKVCGSLLTFLLVQT